MRQAEVREWLGRFAVDAFLALKHDTLNRTVRNAECLERPLPFDCFVLSLLGCVVSEFIASSKGLGFVIKARSQDIDVSTMFAAIIILSAIGVIGTMRIRSVQRRVVFWTV